MTNALNVKKGLTFTSWNIRGANNPVKRGKVLNHLKSLHSDITFLQETHLKNNCHNRLKAKWVKEIYHTSFSTKARGAAIIIKKGIPFIHNSTIADKDGRYIIVSGEIYNTSLTLVNVYAPNMDNPAFFKKVFSLLPNLSQTMLIIGGDFNTPLDPFLDRSASRKIPKNNSSVLINSFLKSMNLIDLWRFTNPSGRDYSFFSAVHNSYSRIDYFLIDARLVPFTTNVKYHTISISDHSPLTFNLYLEGMDPPSRSWRLDPYLLTNKEFCKFIESQIKLYFETNDTPEVTPCTLWEAFKAYLRGCVISYEAAKKKKEVTQCRHLEEQIQQLDRQNALNPTPDLHREITNLKYQLNQLLSGKISSAFLFIKQKHFEFGDKPHKLLARQLKKIEADRAIHKIRDDRGHILLKPKEINMRFLQFYSDLYTSKCNSDPNTMNKFLDECNLSRISHEDSEMLNTDIQATEIQKAIASLKSGKSPGPDGMPVELYKKFSNIFTPFLHRMYNQAQLDGTLPPTLTQATITVIHKKGKDELNVGSYRPISLLNIDYKIYAKILANRLTPLMNTIVHSDQTGFISNRSSTSNLRRLFDILYTDRKIHNDLAILTLDAEKAFDQIEWEYLFEVLKRLNLGERFIKWIRLLYTNPKAQIHTNRNLSSSFHLFRGTRQGCPLSALIFALAIEPLAQSIRLDPQIYGYQTKTTTNKISLYADDILLYVTKPLLSIPSILEKIEMFGKFSGYRINWTKSLLMPVHDIPQTTLARFPFKVTNDKFTYLGIEVTKKLSSIMQSNFPPLLEKLKNKIQFWKTLPISLLGRINAIKMIFLPQILYLFQNIPVFLTKSFFKKIDSIIQPFLWDYKTPRINKKHLTKSKMNGGLSLPNFMMYYWACAFKNINSFNITSNTLPTWLAIEVEDCDPYLPAALVLSPSPLDKAKDVQNPIIHNLFRIWKQIKSHFTHKTLPLSLPIAKNPSFAPSNLDLTFSNWRKLGLCCIRDLYTEGKFASFAQLQTKFKLHNNNFFRYLQVRDYIRKFMPGFETQPQSMLDECFTIPPYKDKFISNIYNKLQTISSPSSNKYKDSWEKDMGTHIPDDIWEESLEYIHSCSYNTRHRLIQFKIIHRLHFSKVKIHNIFPNASSNCDKCQSLNATLFHAFFSCPKVTSYWSDVFNVLSRIFKTTLSPEPLLIILGTSELFRKFTSAQQRFISYSLITAKKLLLMSWKGPAIPTDKMWLRDLSNTLHLERIRYLLKDNLSFFYNIWQPLIDFLQSVSV